MDEHNQKTRVKDSHNPEDEQRILRSASKILRIDQADLVLIHDAKGLLVKRLTTQECWQVQKLNNLPEVEPAN